MNNAHVIGLGRSGIAAARLLHQDGWHVVLSDRNPAPRWLDQQSALETAGITVRLGYSFDPSEAVNLVVVSPGVPWDSPALIAAREQGLEVIGEMELAWRFLKDRPWVGITGTNGKTTTTALTAAIFQAAGFRAPACGNIGYAACELALSDQVPDWVIAEVSSYQIEAAATLAPQIGLWTTFTPDHLQRHYSLDNYFAIKASLLHRCEARVFNGDDPFLRRRIPDHFSQGYWTSIAGKVPLTSAPTHGSGQATTGPITYLEGGWVICQGQPIVAVDAFQMVGQHNWQNLLLAVTAAHLADIAPAAIAAAVANFSGVPHRLEHICTWQSIDFINDSKATNYDAAAVGLQSVTAPVVLIAGGDAKPGDDQAWLQLIQKKVATVLLIGTAAPDLAHRLDEVGYTAYEIVDTMKRALVRARDLAPAQQARTVLLSPACASFDQYPDFEVRGDHFRRLCLEHC
ncbi:UDP-N-acetylmuramoylalanine--D-glutamate ligase [Halomicronema hongdechloris C2206]|uniref:UDP-N-acetylmuramoylalanine--D-glutamate ligase n=1 Tax=Halomicronema hongdechloris C2206 TaxID=1641165 RepID=A0A1Z3HJK5_9CYAN|nr:UDP-N-acetylmuramoyl-L-alanine--D-glutamate ligase [Halomicronema hongdechloris]ASC70446.1 UDP-N-acetylmuramoylalanine--D-glutamate ligase [Halomicronema hongdechloris C2206]